MARSTIPLTLLVCLFVQPALAEFIPIGTPTTITEPGHYYLARDVSCDTCDEVILIDSDRVTLDLNRWTVRGPMTAIRIAPDRTQVTIRNGTVAGGLHVIWQSSSGSTARIRITDTTFMTCPMITATSCERSNNRSQ